LNLAHSGIGQSALAFAQPFPLAFNILIFVMTILCWVTSVLQQSLRHLPVASSIYILQATIPCFESKFAIDVTTVQRNDMEEH
jgi:hypothetical protein